MEKGKSIKQIILEKQDRHMKRMKLDQYLTSRAKSFKVE